MIATSPLSKTSPSLTSAPRQRQGHNLLSAHETSAARHSAVGRTNAVDDFKHAPSVARSKPPAAPRMALGEPEPANPRTQRPAEAVGEAIKDRALGMGQGALTPLAASAALAIVGFATMYEPFRLDPESRIRGQIVMGPLLGGTIAAVAVASLFLLPITAPVGCVVGALLGKKNMPR